MFKQTLLNVSLLGLLTPFICQSSNLDLFFFGPISFTESTEKSKQLCQKIIKKLSGDYRKLGKEIINGKGLLAKYNDPDHQYLFLIYLRSLQEIDMLTKHAAHTKINETLKSILLGNALKPRGTMVNYILLTIDKKMRNKILKKIEQLSQRDFDIIKGSDNHFSQRPTYFKSLDFNKQNTKLGLQFLDGRIEFFDIAEGTPLKDYFYRKGVCREFE